MEYKTTPHYVLIANRRKEIIDNLVEYDIDKHDDWFLDDWILGNTLHRVMTNAELERTLKNKIKYENI